MNIAILGYGSQGASALRFFQKDGNELTVCDKNTELELPEGISAQLGPAYLQGLGRFDLLVRSPSIHPRDVVAANPETPDILKKVTTNTNEFLRICPSRNIIGVTGTKGKGTTSTLITKILEASGFVVHLGGNIGTPPLEMLDANIAAEDWVVLELANFQLIDIKYSPALAVCLMVAPEHMDWHATVDEYIGAKQQLFRWQNPSDAAVFYAENEMSSRVVGVSPAKKIPYFREPGAHVRDGRVVIGDTEICGVEDVKLLGAHNLQNVCAAVTAVWQITQNPQAIKAAITQTSGLPYRLEFVGETGGVKYYNDSFGTTPETAIVAVQAFSQPKVLILGGSDKGADYTELAATVTNSNVKHIVAIGDTGPVMVDAVDNAGGSSIERTVLSGKPSMDQIVAAARSKAESGDVVLLSTGCASFGLFKDYQDRGDQFNESVKLLSRAA